MAILKVKSFAIEASLGKSLSKNKHEVFRHLSVAFKTSCQAKGIHIEVDPDFFRYYELLLVFLS